MKVKWLASRPGHFIFGEKVRGTHWIGVGGGGQNKSGRGGEEKNPCPCREWNPDRPARGSVATPPPGSKL
jgi:hypothetical protein